MVQELSGHEFAQFLATIWERRDWQTEITERGEQFLVAGDQPDGTRGLILVFPGQEQVDAEAVRALETLREQKSLDVPVAATQGTFTDAAHRVARDNGLHLVDPSVVEETASAEGFEDLLAEYTSQSLSSRLLGLFPAVGRPSLPTVDLPTPSVGGKRLLGVGALFLVVLLAGGLLTGALGGVPGPDLGLGGGGFSVTAVSFTQAENASVGVEWDARTQEAVVGPNGTRFEPDNDTAFLVVQFNATNPTETTQVLRERDFAVATGDKRSGPQYLQGAVGQPPVVLDSGETARGYVVFAVPAGTESATLLSRPGPDATPITFERDRSIEFQVSRG
ncbi:MAG: restriction endonuclease [Halobacteriota archaeon]